MRFRLRTLLENLASIKTCVSTQRQFEEENTEWIGELDGKVVVRLYDPIQADMFWESYRIAIISDDPALAAKLRDRVFWSGNECLKLVWRNGASGKVARHAFSASKSYPFDDAGRLLIRGLYG